jgi:integrase
VAYSTGVRLGEILAFSLDDIAEDFEHKPVLWVRKSWSAVEGLKGTKTGNVRAVPISEDMKANLLKMGGQTPTIKALSCEGLKRISPFRPSPLSMVFTAILRLATGHADPAMTDHYDHLTGDQLADIRKAQETRILRFKRA